MAFIDELTITAKAGDGGNGVVRWRHEKGKEFSGPSGGNGGAGGDVFVEAVHDIGALSRHVRNPVFRAERGEDGQKNSMHGAAGEDSVVIVPVGSVITNTETGDTTEVLKESERIRILRGGKGGLGNEHFKSSRNTRPEESTPGTAGERGVFSIELRLIVDAGLIGLPNAGKTSLLNVLTNASAKVGHYQFTTLEPNLGDFYGYILADIPGLIEGASEGKGLGHKFLRHIARTKMLIHCISLERDGVLNAYETVRNELTKHDSELSQKREIVVLTKTDLVSKDVLDARISDIKKKNPNALSVSVIDDESVKNFSTALTVLLKTEE